MPIVSRWFVPGKVIYTDVIGDMSVDDIHVGSKEVVALLEESKHDKVHLIANEAQMGSIPKSIKSFSDASEFMRHPKMGWFMIYPSYNPFAKFVSTIVSGMTKVNHRQCATIEECLENLIRIDPTLPSYDEMLALIPDKSSQA